MNDVKKTTDPRARFIERFRASLADDSFVRLVLGAGRAGETGRVRMTVRPVVVRGVPSLCCVDHYRTRDITRNIPRTDAAAVEALLGETFRTAHLFTLAENLQLEIAPDGKGKTRLSRSKPTAGACVSTAHNRTKPRLLDPGLPFLRELGVTDPQGRVVPAMSHKWKQINRFLEIFEPLFAASGLSGRDVVRVVDFGAGKGYLTFAVHHWLRNTLGVKAVVTGIELREDLVQSGNEVAARCGGEGLRFVRGRLEDYAPGELEVLIALHACDTATDLALHLGVRARAAILLCAPCCHRQIRPQMKPPEVLRPLLRFGVHLGQEADMVTDALRALLLEAAGYRVNLFEFISLEHTDKNRMISAVRRAAPAPSARIRAQIDALKAFYGIREHELERLLGPAPAP